jgi:hypothetical protein
MEQVDTIKDHAVTLKQLLGKKLGLRKGGLAYRVTKAGRLLPGHVRNDIQRIAQAEAMANHPKLERRMDPSATKPAYDRAAAFLTAIDVKDRRKGVLLSILGSVAFNILVVITLLIVVLRWRGFV